MQLNRRHFLTSGAAGAVALAMPFTTCSSSPQNKYAAVDAVLKKQVLKNQGFSSPVIIDTIELLRYQNNFICRVRSKDGAQGLSVSNNMHMVYMYPILLSEVAPFFINKDARDLDALIDRVYTWDSNYKLQGLALWIPLATVEFAILDMLGRIADKSMGELIGDIHNPRVAVYQANNFRGLSAEESIKRIKAQVEETGAKAVKFKVGGRMDNPEEPPGRSEKLIPLVRKAFGDDMTIYADSNGSYDAQEAIRIGRLIEEYKFDFYEEPVPFDWYEATKKVADALSVPIAGGEQEPSMRNFRWLIGNRALDIVQPDMFYFGGMIRSMKVALMAHALAMQCVPHISGSGLGYLYMMHFVSAIPNAGPYHEFKGFNRDIPIECATSSLTSENGIVTVPTGPGLGVQIDPDYVKKHKVVKA